MLQPLSCAAEELRSGQRCWGTKRGPQASLQPLLPYTGDHAMPHFSRFFHLTTCKAAAAVYQLHTDIHPMLQSIHEGNRRPWEVTRDRGQRKAHEKRFALWTAELGHTVSNPGGHPLPVPQGDSLMCRREELSTFLSPQYK